MTDITTFVAADGMTIADARTIPGGTDAMIAMTSDATRASTTAVVDDSTIEGSATTPEIRQDFKDVRGARKEVQDSRKDLRKDYTELRKDRLELRRDIRNGASKAEIMKDRREIRGDYKEIADSRNDLRQDQAKLDTARRELKKRSAQPLVCCIPTQPDCRRQNAGSQAAAFRFTRNSSHLPFASFTNSPVVSQNDRG